MKFPDARTLKSRGWTDNTLTENEYTQAVKDMIHGTLVGEQQYGNYEIYFAQYYMSDYAGIHEEEFDGMAVHACANLPYYITSPVISALIDCRAFESITVMVQKEVAERICAAAGTSEYSAFSIYVQYHTEPEILFEVPRDCFVPQPKVDSAVLRLVPRKMPAVSPQDEALFLQSSVRRSTSGGKHLRMLFWQRSADG